MYIYYILYINILYDLQDIHFTREKVNNDDNNDNNEQKYKEKYRQNKDNEREVACFLTNSVICNVFSIVTFSLLAV